MTRFVTIILLTLFAAAANAQDSPALKTSIANVADKANPVLKDVVSDIVRDETGLRDAGGVDELPLTTLDYPQAYPGEVVYGDVGYDAILHGATMHGEIVNGPTYHAAPQVAYGAALGTPAYRQIPNGPKYNGPTWGLYPKYHRQNKPRHTGEFKNRLSHQWSNRPRFLPSAWRR